MRKPKNANMQKGLKKLGAKKKAKEYIPESLEYFKKSLELVRQPSNREERVSSLQVDSAGLQRAIQVLPKGDRENIEKFWGLTGGPNHSKKLVKPNAKDVAFFEMRNKAVLSLRKLLTLDYIRIFDTKVDVLINEVCKKVNKSGTNISDIEITKLLIAFKVYADNGPKMPFEQDPMSVDTSLNGAFLFDEYEVLSQLCQEIQKLHDQTINLRLLNSFFEMVDFKEMLAIKRSVGIEITDDFNLEDIEIVRTATHIRAFKEHMFPYGAWEVTTEIILGNKKIDLERFKEALIQKKVRNWVDKVEQFRTTRKKELRTSKEVRTLDVYEIGGLEFTDPQEIDFLYLYGDLAEVCA